MNLSLFNFKRQKIRKKVMKANERKVFTFEKSKDDFIIFFKVMYDIEWQKEKAE